MNHKHVNKVWCTKNDVMEDLALATGDVGGLEVDEHCLVYGERPPPRPACDMDDEMKILFSGRAGEIDGDHQFVEPDLKGIMSMIRMVETEDEDYSPKSKPTDVIVISKLNPNVREFVPKSQASQTLHETKKNLTSLKANNNVIQGTTLSPTTNDKVVKGTTASPTTNDKVMHVTTASPTTNDKVMQVTTASPTTNDKVMQVTTASPTTNNNVVQRAIPSPITEKKCSVKPAKTRNTPTPSQSSTTEAEIQSLKDIIVSTNTKDSYQHRREKNAAIATLLRHCTTPPIKKEVKEKPIKLYTPEFFERCKAADFKGTDDSSTVVDENEELNKDTTSQETALAIEVDSIAKDEHTNLTQDVAKDLNLDNAEISECYEEEIEQNKLKVKLPEINYEKAGQKKMKVSLAEPSYVEAEQKNLIVKLPEPSYVEAEQKKLIVKLAEPSYVEAEQKKPATEALDPTYEEIEQKKSIAKVQQWLNGPNLPKKPVAKPVILAGPIAYKRKEVMSPTSTSSTTVDKKISKQDDKAFVPSTYAKELRQKYEKNKKAANKPLNIWDNLEEQLKMKDEEIRKKASQDQ